MMGVAKEKVMEVVDERRELELLRSFLTQNGFEPTQMELEIGLKMRKTAELVASQLEEEGLLEEKMKFMWEAVKLEWDFFDEVKECDDPRSLFMEYRKRFEKLIEKYRDEVKAPQLSS